MRHTIFCDGSAGSRQGTPELGKVLVSKHGHVPKQLVAHVRLGRVVGLRRVADIPTRDEGVRGRRDGCGQRFELVEISREQTHWPEMCVCVRARVRAAQKMTCNVAHTTSSEIPCRT